MIGGRDIFADMMRRHLQPTSEDNVEDFDSALAGFVRAVDADLARVDGGNALPAWFPHAFGHLRISWFAGGELEDTFKAAFGLSEDVTLWDAVQVFQRLYPHADLSRPWPEPILPAESGWDDAA